MYTIKSNPEDFRVTEKLNYTISEKGHYGLFLMEKREYNTLDALGKISSMLTLPMNKIGYCGNKDRIAITKQYITIPQVYADKAKKLAIKDISLTYVGLVDERLNLGDLDGNAFEIMVWKTERKKPRTIDETKVLNLFGEQRFGTHNAEIGKNMIINNFKGAVELLIKDNTYAELLRNHLEQHERDYIGALRIVGTSLLKLFIHAYQSELWNKAAKRLVELYPYAEQQIVPILGFGTELSGPIEDIYTELMEEEDITPRDFIIKQMKEISSEGQLRNLYMEISDLRIVHDEKEKGWKLAFTLGKGSYATVLIETLFGND